MSVDAEILNYFGLRPTQRGNKQVTCPFHDDDNASASVHVRKRLFNCFGCKKSYNFEQLAEALREKEAAPPEEPADVAEDPAPAIEPVPSTDSERLIQLGIEHIASRGMTYEQLVEQGLDVFVDEDPGSKTYGYLIIEKDGWYVGRNLEVATKERPRYWNKPGPKEELFWIGEPPSDAVTSPTIWLTEGVWDALALKLIGAEYVVAGMGSSVSDEQAYALAGRAVFIAYDHDAAGFTGAKKSAEKLSEFGATPIIVPPPRGVGKDFSEAYANNRERLRVWYQEQLAEFGRSDEAYIQRQLSGSGEPLLLIPTGIPRYDSLLGGGYRAGVHVIGAEPGAGKSSFALRYAITAAQRGYKVQYHTYEISKRQCWARLASAFDPLPWEKLELDMTRVSEAAAEQVRELSSRISVRAGWPATKITHTADDYDVIVVDYIQRMPGPFGENESRHNVAYNITRLSDLARDKGKIVLVVSSMPREQYGKVSMKSFKEAGEIEYVSQTLTGFLVGEDGRLIGQLVKNTRGDRGSFYLHTDLGHLEFHETHPKVV